MKTLNFKFTLVILCSLTIAFTSCSKEEIATNDTTDLVSGNEKATDIRDYWVKIDDPNNIDWEAIEAARIEGQEIDSRCPECEPSPSPTYDCSVKVCATLLGPGRLAVEGAPYVFKVPDTYCVTIPINNGDSRTVSYKGIGGATIQEYIVGTNTSLCTLWSVPPSTNTTLTSTTLSLYCGAC